LANSAIEKDKSDKKLIIEAKFMSLIKAFDVSQTIKATTILFGT
jgi:hypothetical protein